MAETMSPSTAITTNLIFVVLLFLAHSPGSHSATVTLVNNYKNTIWVAIVSSPGTLHSPPPSTSGLALQAGESNVIALATTWSGRIWGRSLCSVGPTQKFSCVTGDCGSSRLECVDGGHINSPATVAELTLTADSSHLNSYRVSLGHGYNLPMIVEPLSRRTFNCMAAGCTVDLSTACPDELKVIQKGEVVACQSGCQAFGGPEYCCGECENLYSRFFKTTCPDSYISAYNNGTFTCPSVDYLITFQHSEDSTSSSRREPGNPTAAEHNKNPVSAIIAEVVSAVILIVVGGGYGAYKVKCFFSNRNFEAEVEMSTTE